MPNITIFPDTEESDRDGAADFLTSKAGLQGARPLTLAALWRRHRNRCMPARIPDIKIAWTRPKSRICLGDEQVCAAGARTATNRMARTALLAKVPLPVENIHRMRGEAEPEEAAAAYAKDLARTFGGEAGAGKPPPEGFDLILHLVVSRGRRSFLRTDISQRLRRAINMV